MAENKKIKYIYVVFSATPYKMGKFIRVLVRSEYNHISLSMSPDIKTLYSYSRHYLNTALYGGFNEESLMRYQCRKKDSKIMVCALPVSEDQYDRLQGKLETIKADRDDYIYNFISAVTSPFGKPVRLKNSYTCIEFVCMLLSYIGVYRGKDPSPSFDRLRALLEKYKIFEGRSRKYSLADGWGNDGFPNRRSFAFYVSAVNKNAKKLIKKYRER